VTLPSWYVRISDDLDVADSRAAAIVPRLSTTQLNWRPRPDTWSIGQCLEHLCISNELYVEPIVAALRGRPTGPVDEISPGWFGQWFLRKYIEPTTQRTRARAPARSAPSPSSVDASILGRFIASNAAIRNVIDRARAYDVNLVRFRNPFVPLIYFTVGTGFQIIARHNHRHLLQAERVAQSQEFPASR
jgi:hypothetical protein